MSEEKDDPFKHGFIIVNGQTFVAPPPPELEDGQISLVSSFVISGKKCPRCDKFLSKSQSSVGGQTSKIDLPEHSEEDCDLVIVDEVHGL